MGEQSFATRAAQMLDRLETDIEQAADEAGVDIDLTRQDNVIDIEFEDGTKVVINSHQAASEIWVAARSGGYHFKPVDSDRWIDGRSGRELRDLLGEQLSAQAGQPIRLP